MLYGTKGILRIYDDPAYSLKLITVRRGEGALRAGGHPDQRQPDRLRRHRLLHGLPDRQHAPAISGESVLTAMRAVFACLESSRTGRAVSVAQD
ncbi:MAG: hypothetical protein ACLRNQ_20620 [Flavonifractor plautii]